MKFIALSELYIPLVILISSVVKQKLIVLHTKNNEVARKQFHFHKWNQRQAEQ